MNCLLTKAGLAVDAGMGCFMDEVTSHLLEPASPATRRKRPYKPVEPRFPGTVVRSP